MTEPQSSAPTFRHYFVDEAGDPNLFKHRGKVIVGENGTYYTQKKPLTAAARA